MKHVSWFLLFYPLISIAFLFGLVLPAEAQIIYNGLTRYPPYEIYDTDMTGGPPPSGYGHYNSSVGVNAEAGYQYAKCDLFVRSDWPWPFAVHNVSAQAELGSMDYYCTRTGPYSLLAEGVLNGFAAICVPQAPHFWGGAESELTVKICVTLYHTNLDIPMPMYSWRWTLYDRYSQHTLEDPVLWNDVEFSLGPSSSVTLDYGWSYALSMTLEIEGHVGVTGSTQGGYLLGVFDEWTGTWLSVPYEIHGSSRLTSLRITNDDPDDDPPSTQVIEPAGGRTLLCPGETVTLQAEDVAGGFGMGETYWTFQGGPIQTGTGPIAIPETGTLQYWSVDRVGNPEWPHNQTLFSVNDGSVAPTLVSVLNGSTVYQQQVTLVWNSVAEADRYRVQVDDDTGFGSPLHDMQPTNTNVGLSFPEPITTYYWRVTSYDDFCDLWGSWSDTWSFTVDVMTGVGPVPGAYCLAQNHPNPFNPMTTICYDLPKSTPTYLRIFDVSGRLVRTLVGGDVVEAGRHEIQWNARNNTGQSVAAGTYFCRLDAGEYGQTRSMTLVK